METFLGIVYEDESFFTARRNLYCGIGLKLNAELD